MYFLIPNRVGVRVGICQKPKTNPIGILFCRAARVYPNGSQLAAVKKFLQFLRGEALAGQGVDRLRRIPQSGSHVLNLLQILRIPRGNIPCANH